MKTSAMRFAFAAAVFCAAVSLFALAIRFAPYPSLKKFLARGASARVLDRSGELIQVLSLENGLRREFAPLEKIPEALVDAFVTAEDKRFFSHHGIDLAAVARAAAQNAEENRTVSGASTITMQLARMIRPRKKRTLLAKAREAVDALRLESRFPKRKLLELYLNNVPFGFNTEGAASAARTFFGVEISDLTFEQSCCLAVIPRRPALYNPIDHPDECARAALDLARETNGASGRNLSLGNFLRTARSSKRFLYPTEMPHYVRWLLKNRREIFDSPEIRLSASLRAQKNAERLLAREVSAFARNRVTNGAALAIDTQSGEILAWVGSVDFFDERAAGQIDGVTIARQPGSSMKPFLYVLALERGFSPSSILPDIPSEFGFENLYVPQNFNNRFSGPVRLRVALASSLNVPAARLLNQLGVETYKKKLRDLEFFSLEKNDAGLGLALGNGEVALFELSQAFSVFARDGIFVPLRATKNEARNERRVYDEDAARLICDILSDKDARAAGFGYSQIFNAPFPAMFKTGTANQFQNITALAATPLYTVGVWMGNFSGATVIGKTGSSIPAKVARDILVSLQGNDAPKFKESARFEKKRICALSGMRAGEFCADTVTEYERGEGEVCSWHTADGVSYPAEYSQWFRLKSRAGTVSNGGALKIISPRDGSVFFHDESLPPEKQNIIVEAVGGSEDSATVIVDGEAEETVARPFLRAVNLSRGNHVVAFVCGEERAQVAFTVK